MKKKMNKNFDLIFLGLAKNVEKTINIFFKSVENLSKLGLKILVIIGENGSNDNTKKKLELFSSNYFELKCIDLEILNKYKNRIIRLGHGRQILKDFVFDNSFKTNFLSIVDLDEVIADGFNANVIHESLNFLKENKKYLFGISAKSKPYYYDLLPLIISDYFERDIYKIQTRINLFRLYSDRKKNIYDFQKKITNMRDIETVSSHNGLTTYIYEDFIKGSYLNTKSNKIVSEHINLNKSINSKDNRFVYMSNDIILKTPKEHLPLSNTEWYLNQLKKIYGKI